MTTSDDDGLKTQPRPAALQTQPHLSGAQPHPRGAQWVALKDIIIEPALQARSRHLDPATLTKYRGVVKASEGKREAIGFPPITLALTDGKLYLIDGFHRVEAHRLESQVAVLAEVLEGLGIKQMRWRAAAANMGHGKPLNRHEVREAFRRFIAAREHHRANPEAGWEVVAQRPGRNVMTLGEIAAVFGKAKSTIIGWFKSDDLREYNRLYNRDGQRRYTGEGMFPRGRYFEPAPSPADLIALSLGTVVKHVEEVEDEEDLTATLQTVQRAAITLSRKLGRDKTAIALNGGWPEGWIPPERWFPVEGGGDF